jgi:hypothetical protein
MSRRSSSGRRCAASAESGEVLFTVSKSLRSRARRWTFPSLKRKSDKARCEGVDNQKCAFSYTEKHRPTSLESRRAAPEEDEAGWEYISNHSRFERCSGRRLLSGSSAMVVSLSQIDSKNGHKSKDDGARLSNAGKKEGPGRRKKMQLVFRHRPLV